MALNFALIRRINMQQNRQNLNWHTSFFIPERMPYCGELYWIKINMALLVRDGELDQDSVVTLENLIRCIAQSESQPAKEMLNRMLEFALECAINKNFHDVIAKIIRYREYLLPHDSFVALGN